MPAINLSQTFAEPGSAGVLALFLTLSVLLLLHRATGRGARLASYLQYVWALLLVFSLAGVVSFTAAAWLLAGLSFLALREYFALAPLRIQDRWAMFGAYCAIPFMTWYIQTAWYGMFIISIPVYAFLLVPALVALGGREFQGTVQSIGALDFGLFLFVYCAGHISYLARISLWAATFLLMTVAGVDVITELLGGSQRWRGLSTGARTGILLAICTTAGLAMALAFTPWADLPTRHLLTLGGIIPSLVLITHMTLKPIEKDLHVDRFDRVAGRGAILRGLRSFLFAGPVVFHYVRYFLT